MKLVKILLLLMVFTIVSSLAVLNYQKDSTNYHDPLDITRSDYYQKLKFALSSNHIELSSPIALDPYTQKITFNASQPNRNSNSFIILSTQKDPYLQSASLQKIFTEATIKGKNVHLIDLSLNHPYATLQDN